MRVDLPESWRRVAGHELDQPYFQKLAAFVDGERARAAVYPLEADVFNALTFTPYDQVRVVLLGQDPYREPGQAHGLCFSVRPSVTPPSLRNIFIDLRDDLGCHIPNNGIFGPVGETRGAAAQHGAHSPRARTELAPGQRLGALYRRHHASREREGQTSGLRALGQRRTAGGRAGGSHTTCGSPGGASFATFGPQRLLRQPAVLGHQCGAGGSGSARDRVADSRCVTTFEIKPWSPRALQAHRA